MRKTSNVFIITCYILGFLRDVEAFSQIQVNLNGSSNFLTIIVSCIDIIICLVSDRELQRKIYFHLLIKHFTVELKLEIHLISAKTNFHLNENILFILVWNHPPIGCSWFAKNSECKREKEREREREGWQRKWVVGLRVWGRCTGRLGWVARNCATAFAREFCEEVRAPLCGGK